MILAQCNQSVGQAGTEMHTDPFICDENAPSSEVGSKSGYKSLEQNTFIYSCVIFQIDWLIN